MRNAGQRLVWTIAIAGVALVLAPMQAGATPAKCNKELAKWGAKAATDSQKEIQKCVDGMQKELDKEAAAAGSGKVDKAADKCELRLDKIGLDETNISDDLKSKLGKALAKIVDAATKSKCTSEDLQGAGFPSGNPNTAGRILMAAAVKDAWSQQVQATTETVTNFQAAANATGEAGGCPTCTVFVQDAGGNGNVNGPCPRLACSLGGSSGITAQAAVTGTGSVSLPVSLIGDVTVGACNLPQVFPSTIVLTGEPATNRAQITGIADICLGVFRSQGTLDDGSGLSSSVDFDTAACSDHDTGTSNECSGFTSCTDGTSKTGDTTTCYDVTASGFSPGDGYYALGQTIAVDVFSANTGPDGIPCTADDTSAPSDPANIVLTTGQATAELHDGGAGGTLGSVNLNTTVTGSAFTNADALANGTLVGAFSAIDDDGTGLGDTVTDITFQCI